MSRGPHKPLYSYCGTQCGMRMSCERAQPVHQHKSSNQDWVLHPDGTCEGFTLRLKLRDEGTTLRKPGGRKHNAHAQPSPSRAKPYAGRSVAAAVRAEKKR